MSNITHSKDQVSSKSSKNIELLLQQNWKLEREITRLNRELDEATNGILMRGYLYKFRDREIAWASKWSLRYFLLQGKSLSYFVDDHDHRPRRTYDLSGCVVQDDGPKKSGQYYCFSIIFCHNNDFETPCSVEQDEEHESAQDDRHLLLRLSSVNRAESLQWMRSLEHACQPDEYLLLGSVNQNMSGNDHLNDSNDYEIDQGLQSLETTSLSDPQNTTPDTLSKKTIERVKSSADVLQKSLSRMALSHSDLPSKLLASVPRDDVPNSAVSTTPAATNYTTVAAQRFNAPPPPQIDTKFSSINTQLQTAVGTGGDTSAVHTPKSTTSVVSRTQVRPRFPASKPIHMEAKSSPLSSGNRPSEQSYRGFFNLGVIILFIANISLIVENFKKHGFVAQFPRFWESTIENCTENSLAGQCTENELLYGGISLMLQAVFSWITSITMVFLVEVMICNRLISERVNASLQFIIGVVNLVIPIVWVWTSDTHPLLSMVYLFQAVILWMKMISYAHVNYDLRQLKQSVKKNISTAKSKSTGNLTGVSVSGSGSGSSSVDNSSHPTVGVRIRDQSSVDNSSHSTAGVHTQDHSPMKIREKSTASGPEMPSVSRSSSSLSAMDAQLKNAAIDGNPYGLKDLEPPFLSYPQNISYGNLIFYSIAPTLCYQLNYPRSLNIRPYFVISVLIRLFLLGSFMAFSVQQYILPTLQTSVSDIKDKDFAKICEIILKLSIPNTYVWLLMFYTFFHLHLNLLAEITRFGDRLFYKDWWNSRTISAYWKNWNLPVHYWMLRHLYYPLVNAGVSKGLATTVVFFFSAAMHEIVISVPFRYISGHAFAGMMAQAPLVSVTRLIDSRFDNGFLGNVIFWMLFCVIGQPMGILLVYYDLWQVKSI